ncbi:hypothetical protein B7C51_15695 [Paenibacillus larvae subsp. pulvifaciens]|uniref:Uncharacterized protein n=1 Tax=Paenibacillus larvae subsp. pulvifaciens TaxID=1477 RepID=A0A1V0UUM7_9BACL|nr:hypothetical protein [Paenibacillus larvae]ARF68933.1 hypothetical protein B7C51_15695 [Paenibacillus larvae subsp. pulvifaciens]
MSIYSKSFIEMVENIQKNTEQVRQIFKDFQVPQIPPVNVAIPPEAFEQLNSFAARMGEVQSQISQILATPSKVWAEMAAQLSNIRELKAFQEPIPEEIVPEYENLSSAVERAEILIENVNVTVNINVVKEEQSKRGKTWYAAAMLILTAIGTISSLNSNTQNAKTETVRYEYIEVVDKMDRFIDVTAPRFPKIKAE